MNYLGKGNKRGNSGRIVMRLLRLRFTQARNDKRGKANDKRELAGNDILSPVFARNMSNEAISIEEAGNDERGMLLIT